MLVEQAAGNQVALHLPKFFPDLSSPCSTGPPLLKLVFGEPAMTKVGRRNPRTALFGLCASAGSAMEAAAAILPVGRSLTRGAPTCLRTAPLPRPIRSEPPLDTDVHIVFCQHQ